MNYKIINFLLCIACLLAADFFWVTHSQVTICSSYETDISYTGNDLSFTYDPTSASGHIKSSRDFWLTQFLCLFLLECSNLCAKLYRICSGFTFWKPSATLSICYLKNFTSTPVRCLAKDRNILLRLRVWFKLKYLTLNKKVFHV